MKTDPQTKDFGIAILRMIVGLVFLVHGYQKLFVYGFGGVGASFAKMGIPSPAVFAIIVTLVEFLGGIALLLGLFTRWAALLLAINMLVAVVRVHLPSGFFLPRGYEYALTLLCANIALILTGPGRPALDRMMGRR